VTQKSSIGVWLGRLSGARAGLVAVFAVVVLGTLALIVVRGTMDHSPERTTHSSAGELARRAPPKPELNLVKPLTPNEAFQRNLLVAAVQGPIEQPRAFVLPSGAGLDLSRRKAVDCLTAAVYYEAGGESAQGKQAVAQVVLNRVRHPAYPSSVCGVVYQGSERATGCQFTFTCDGSLRRQASAGGWLVARGIAEAALAGAIEPSVGTATHFHTVWVVPYWASSLQKITTVGAHIFYRFPGFWGKRSAFSDAYAGETALTEAPVGLVAPVVDELITPPSVIDPALSPSGTLVSNEGQLVLPDESPVLHVDKERGALIVDDAASSLSIDAAPPEQ
jgi:hypothetical protein